MPGRAGSVGSCGDVVLRVSMVVVTLLPHDVAKRYGDQDGYGNAHSYAHPDYFLIDCLVGSTCKSRRILLENGKSNCTTASHVLLSCYICQKHTIKVMVSEVWR